MQQENVKQFINKSKYNNRNINLIYIYIYKYYNTNPKLVVCPKTAVWSLMRINRELFFGPRLSKNGFCG